MQLLLNPMTFQQQQERKWRQQQLGAVLTMGGIDSTDYPEAQPYGLDSGVGFDVDADRTAQFQGMSAMRQRAVQGSDITTSDAYHRVLHGLRSYSPPVTLVPSQACACSKPQTSSAPSRILPVTTEQRVWLSEHKRSLMQTAAVMFFLVIASI